MKRLTLALLLVWTAFMLQCGSNPQAQSVGPQGPPGPQGPAGPQCPAGPQGQTGPGGVNGVRESFTSGTWTAPPNITHVMAEMWGAGGGGTYLDPTCNTLGGGGGGGAYSLNVVSVTPGVTYGIVIGTGGNAGIAGNSGANGGDSQFTDGTNIPTHAGGGQGGSVTLGAPGASGGQADTNAMINHAGISAPFPVSSTFGPSAQTPGPPYAQSLLPNASAFYYGVTWNLAWGGGGGVSCGALGAQNGGPGYVQLRW
jgi:hypothetical protein